MRARTLCIPMSTTCCPVFEANHQILNSVLDGLYLNIHKIWYGNLTIFRLSDLEWYHCIIVQIKYLFIIDFEKRDKNSKIL